MQTKPLTAVPRRPPQAAQAGNINPAGLPAQRFIPPPYPQPAAAPIESRSVVPQPREPVPVTTVAVGGTPLPAPGMLPVSDLRQIRQHANAIAQRGADLPANRQEVK
jgi:hypothetical protein